ncbi:MAG TPA: GNAT family N-acetyltransferase [Arsenophonus nasoniae]|uniref:GNAT family N-acetyltransferase n=1 Tax=Arsenophonus nasoniae TaxID=638 RepID=UPI0038797166
MVIILNTPRLILREWREADRHPFHRLNSDPDVMRYFPHLLSKIQSDAFIDSIRQKFIQQQGWGLWAVELRAKKQFIGFVGLNIPAYALPFMPCIEIGWRLAKPFWRQGLAYEAAHHVLDFAFRQRQMQEIISFTAKINYPSECLMKKLAMEKDAHNFLHPALPSAHPLQEHILYRLNQQQWLKKRAN